MGRFVCLTVQPEHYRGFLTNVVFLRTIRTSHCHFQINVDLPQTKYCFLLFLLHHHLNCENILTLRELHVFASLQRGVIRRQLEEEEEWRHKDHLSVGDEGFLCHGLHHRPRQLSDRAVVPWSVLYSVYVDVLLLLI